MRKILYQKPKGDHKKQEVTGMSRGNEKGVQEVLAQMELNREAISGKTHYGVKIYAHVLRQYYKDEVVLVLRGRHCLPAKNPFNGDKQTLHVGIVDGEARHHDTEVADCKGDAYDFAQLHYQLEGAELLTKLNEELGLRIGRGFGNCDSAQQVGRNEVKKITQITQFTQEGKSGEIQVPEFSFFKKPVRNTVPSGGVSLVEVYEKIKGISYQKCTNALRMIQDEKEARAYKAKQFDYVTFSGTFVKRENSALVQHSGLFAVDFDHLEDVEGLKQRLLADPYFETELLFVSPSGHGLKWVIPIDITKATHQQYAVGISNYLLHTYGQKMDASGKDVARACFLPCDPHVYIHPKYT
ncbi:hypothetical protein OCK74_22750 [Chitinophagaceae bacterium LB-8]|uniref:BT4734-like N-terminal domain-containing protein n=1 Tax=Paraflavisolibacter caeni TaxID=2982496 RepID=A0A9X2Y065_9BACT|nr:BT4734/BF3469 family protein [Paraflavisolibacter caeni]MCU7551957.1 hypothetical protein [Paraflavisolibacter caeni]